jgi:high-affinity nickel-transport protein
MRKTTSGGSYALHTRGVCLVTSLLAANLGAWIWAWAAFAGRPALLGTALLAWVFGLRHAVDADHIAAIDNVVRKLMHENRRPLDAGFFFALGHSTIVVAASIATALTAAALQTWFDDFKTIGTAVSAVLLLLIAFANLAILRGVWRNLRLVSGGGRIEALDAPLTAGGVLARLFRPLFRAVRQSWHMYPLGFLFGLGFDTATEIGVLGISATQAAQGMSPWQTLVFPALFTAGMALVDTADSMLMVGAYGWAFVQPLRRLRYNLAITAASVLVALLIGGIEVLGLLADRQVLRGSFWSALGRLNDDLGSFGFAVVGILLLAWGVSTLIYRRKSYRTAT